MYRVDLNADLGESFGVYTIGQDVELAPLISSANVACGFHASDPMVMNETVQLLKRKNVSIGAHPGFPDLMGFGRRQLDVSPLEAKAYLLYQLGALKAFATAHQVPLQHVKPHGALYNLAATDYSIAYALAEAVAEFDKQLIFLGLAGSEMIKAAKDCGLRVASEVFADRAYTDEGLLVNRRLPNALIHDSNIAIQRVVQMVKQGTVMSITGKEVPLQADSICVHGDDPQALTFVEMIRQAFAEEGITISSLSEIV